ncbi:cysteine hydrolase family protein [Thalassobacillus pellis]|uniref:cysteine hydrolase family protein n=1 Tax=Thalassobacillus pellis TaxID=748008 RepID=UPI001960E6AF|nr:isochorismatase family cysteine hydrolase [Thalassobacillus pellis]MBM7553736.1 nicotinamidase-related amidase [Thalassobacillus pellis]
MTQSNTALLIIDIINKMDFDGGENLLKNALPMADRLKKFKKRTKEKGIPVIYVNDNFGLWQDNAAQIVEECKKGTGRPVIEKMIPDEDDFFVIKPKHSGFFGTQLDILLHQLGVSKLILTGTTGDICVLFTGNGAYMRGYDLNIPEDCVVSESEEDNENALKIMRRSIFADTTPSDQLDLDQLLEKK